MANGMWLSRNVLRESTGCWAWHVHKKKLLYRGGLRMELQVTEARVSLVFVMSSQSVQNVRAFLMKWQMHLFQDPR